MPLDRYTCDDCRESFEQMRPKSGSTATVAACPQCGSEAVRLAFGLPSKPLPSAPATNCRGDGPPCGASFCGRSRPG
jgi:putative FmdB family regulatory protein